MYAIFVCAVFTIIYFIAIVCEKDEGVVGSGDINGQPTELKRGKNTVATTTIKTHNSNLVHYGFLCGIQHTAPK